MELTFQKAENEDGERIFRLNKELIFQYETLEEINLDYVLSWVQKKITSRMDEYTVICADGKKAGYYHFFRNEEGEYELDDLYTFPEFRNQGIGSAVIKRCCSSVKEPVMLYVFARNQGAVSLYNRMGFQVVETIKDSRLIMKRAPDLMGA